MLLADGLPALSTDNWLTIIGFVTMGALYVSNNRTTAKIIGTRLEVVDATLLDSKHDLQNVKREMKEDVQDVTKEVKKLSVLVTEQAVTNNRLAVMESRFMSEGARIDSQSTELSTMRERLQRYIDRKVLGDD